MKQSIYLLFIAGFFFSCENETENAQTVGIFERERLELLTFIEKPNTAEQLYFEAFEDRSAYYLAYVTPRAIPDSLQSDQLLGYYRIKSKGEEEATTFEARLLLKDSVKVIELRYFNNRPSAQHPMHEFDPKIVARGVTFEECGEAFFESEEYLAALAYVNETCEPVITGPCCNITGLGFVCIDYWIMPTRIACLLPDHFAVARVPFTLENILSKK